MTLRRPTGSDTGAETWALSCFIIAKNEADRIGATITSVRPLVDEVVVVDSGSTDATVAVAEAAGARVIYNAWPGFGQQKRFAEEQCAHDWLFNLDADEVVSPALAREIDALRTGGPPPFAGYLMRDNVVYPGQARPRPLARDHTVLRLYDRRRMRFRDSTLHDNVEDKGLPLGRFKGELYHFAVRTFDDLIAKCDERATYNAANAKRKTSRSLAVRIVGELPFQFLKYYLWRRHCLGGLAGFQFAAITAFYRWVRIVRMREGVGASELNTTSKRPGRPDHPAG